MTGVSDSATPDSVECPFCKAEADPDELCDHALGFADITFDEVQGPLADRVIDFTTLVDDAFSEKRASGKDVTWDNLTVQSLWDSLPQMGIDDPDDLSISPEEVYKFVFSFLIAAGGDLVGPSLHSASSWRFMYSMNPLKTIEDALEMLRAELKSVGVEVKPKHKRPRRKK